jgi:hypothetical protein
LAVYHVAARICFLQVDTIVLVRLKASQMKLKLWVREEMKFGLRNTLGFPSRGGHLNELSESSFVLTFTRGDAGAPKNSLFEAGG